MCIYCDGLKWIEKEEKEKTIIDGCKQDKNWHCYKMTKNPPPGKHKIAH